MLLSRYLIAPLLAASACLAPVKAFDFVLHEEDADPGLALVDVETGISDIKTLFTNAVHDLEITGVAWNLEERNGTDILRWENFIDGELHQSGTENMTDILGHELPSSIACGSVTPSNSGRRTITCKLYLHDTMLEGSGEYETYAAGVSIIPLFVVLILAMTTQMVEFSLFFAVFVGSCIVEGNVNQGFKELLENYILVALADIWHGYVYLFTLFLSGMVGMMEKSGGMLGFTQWIAKYAKTSRAAQFATFGIGCLVFFDDYANTLLAGQTMRPVTDLLFVSREKLAFIVDATAAPIASLVPISSWVGFEVSLIQEQIDRIKDVVGEENLTINDSALAVFLQSIKYRYYPIFMMMIIPILIFAKRDFGPMLIAERKTQVYERTDGGDGTGGANTEEEGEKKENEPRPDTPLIAFNMLIPIVLLVFFIFFLLVKSGDDGSGTQSFMDKIESSDSYQALLWGTMAAAILSGIMYMLQIVQGGKLVVPTGEVIKGLFFARFSNSDETEALAKTSATGGDVADKEEGDELEPPVLSRPRPLMSLYESVEAFLYGMGRIFPALIVLTLAWASGSMMIAVGADRLFSRWIVGGVSAESLPTLSFIISLFMALATGTSWGTMTILFPLICLPTYQVSNGDERIFYATIAGILSGSVAGDHMSPISDTTVLSSLASDCNLLAHVVTQAPYAALMSIFAILFGTLPVGNSGWPNIVGILLGLLAIVLFVYFVCAPIVSPTGNYDLITRLFLLCKKDKTELEKLKEDTVKAYQKIIGELPPDEAIGDDNVAEDPEATDALNKEAESSTPPAEKDDLFNEISA